MTTAALIPMKWADDDKNAGSMEHCACCGRKIKGVPKHWVQASADMGDVLTPEIEWSDESSGGFFPVGATCAKRNFPGFTHSGAAA